MMTNKYTLSINMLDKDNPYKWDFLATIIRKENDTKENMMEMITEAKNKYPNSYVHSISRSNISPLNLRPLSE